MRITVLSKNNFDKFMRVNPMGVFIKDSNVETLTNWFFISICNTHGIDSQSWFHQDHKNVQRLFFDDLLPEDPVLGQEKLFNNIHARRIVEFIKKFNNDSNVLVHCRAGKSRSAAVGMHIADKFGVQEGEFIHDRDICPNIHVLRTLHQMDGWQYS